MGPSVPVGMSQVCLTLSLLLVAMFCGMLLHLPNTALAEHVLRYAPTPSQHRSSGTCSAVCSYIFLAVVAISLPLVLLLWDCCYLLLLAVELRVLEEDAYVLTWAPDPVLLVV